MNFLSSLIGFGRKKITPLIQEEIVECGLASMAMVVTYLGRKTTIRELRNRYPPSRESGHSLYDLIVIAGSLGLQASPVKFKLESMDSLGCPCILHWGQNHFVVLEKVQNGKLTIVDPALGRRVITYNEAVPNLSGYALELTHDVTFNTSAEIQERGLAISDFFKYVSGIPAAFSLLLIAGIILQIIGLCAPLYVQYTIDEAIKKVDSDILYLLSIIFIFVFIYEVVFTYVYENLKSYFKNAAHSQIKRNIASYMLRLPINYFSFRTAGDTLSRLGSSLDISRYMTNGLPTIVVSCFMVVVSIALMFYYSVVLASLVAAGMIMFSLSRYLFHAPLKVAMGEAVQKDANANSYLLENISNIHSIKLSGNENERSGIWKNAFVEYIIANRKYEKIKILFDAFSKLFINSEQVVIILVGGLFIMEGQLTIGSIYAFIQYKNIFANAVITILETLLEREAVKVHLDRVDDLVVTEAEGRNSFESQDFVNDLKIAANIVVKNLDYSPRGSNKKILRGVNMHIDAGEMVGVIGKTGSGKTTLLQTLTSLYKVEDGHLFIDGHDLNNLDLYQYRKQIGVVTQHDQLFRGTVLENICSFASEANLKHAKVCCELACINSEIEKFGLGYQTTIGENAGFLSAGQKQRLIIARMLYKNPSILLLDEFTSHLDPDTAKRICINIKSLSITTLLITHDLENLAYVDRIYSMTDGQLSPAKISREVEA